MLRLMMTKGNVTGQPTNLPAFRITRPCYLADLRGEEVPPGNIHNIDLPNKFVMKVTMDGKGQPWGHETPPPLNSRPIKTGDIHQFNIRGIRYHPIHMHVNPMQ